MLTAEKARMLGALRKAHTAAYDRLADPPVTIHLNHRGGFRIETVDMTATHESLKMLEEMINMIENEETKTAIRSEL